MSAQRNSPKPWSKPYLPKTERKNDIGGLIPLQEFRENQSHFRRPYPYTQGENPNGYKEHEREPAADGFPVH